MNFDCVEDAFHEALKQGVFPGAVLLVARDDDVVYEQAFGSRFSGRPNEALKKETLFDLASLTKPLATALALMLLVHEKKIRLDDRVTRFLPSFGVFDKDGVTFRQLLNHSSGLPAWKPYYEEIVNLEKSGRVNLVASSAAKAYVLEQIHREKPLNPPGKQALYSDLGFMVLGQVVETISGASLDRFCHERIFQPLGLPSMRFIDLTQVTTRRMQPVQEVFAPTEHCPWRQKVLCGEVHDDNAYAMGGIAGHAGLFSRARDIHSLVACLSRCLQGKDFFLPREQLQEFLTKNEDLPNSTFALGWDTPAPAKPASGSCFSRQTVGHLGFTGTSIWWDLDRHCHVVLLTNRVHPSRNNEKIRDFRPHIHDRIMEALLS